MATPPRLDLNWRLPARANQAATQALVRSLGITPQTAELLVNRGITTPAEANAYFNPQASPQHNPLLMKGMAKAAERVKRALANSEHIVIYGDYDADGIPATALLKVWLSRFTRVSSFIPNREDGYGLSLAAARYLLTLKPGLVITVDCGSSDHEAVKFLTANGVDVLVTDHHLTLKGAPPTPYFINPSRSDGETYPYKHLCGCGVAYKLIQALLGNRLHEPALYDLVLISTIGDQVPLTGENRFYAKVGLARLRQNAQGNVGLRALVRVSGRRLDALDAMDIGWKVCPRINAVGRMGANPNMVVELLSTSDLARAEELAREMSRLNSRRQNLTDELYEQAISQVGIRPPAFIVAYLPEATVGVAGLVAAKLVETYARPTLVVNAEGRGSGRAPAGMEIMPFMLQLQHMGIFGQPRKVNGETVVPDFGGHAGACGFHNVDVGALRNAAKSLRVPSEKIGAVAAELVMPLAALTRAFGEEVDSMAPFGVGNPDPTVVIASVTVREQVASKDGRHLLLVLSDGSESRRAVWFGAGAYAGSLSGTFDVMGRPTFSSYSGTPEMVLSAMRRSVALARAA